MRTYTLVFVFTTVLLCTEYVDGIRARITKYVEHCSEIMCMEYEKCQKRRIAPDTELICPTDLECCDIVKPQYRTYCRHHGGQCMTRCGSIFRPHKGICFNNQVCCVLAH